MERDLPMVDAYPILKRPRSGGGEECRDCDEQRCAFLKVLCAPKKVPKVYLSPGANWSSPLFTQATNEPLTTQEREAELEKRADTAEEVGVEAACRV